MNRDELFEIFSELMKAFSLKGKLLSYEAIKSGNINDTYSILTDYNGKNKQYIIQRVNQFVFPNPEKIASNVYKVTKHIESKLRARGVTDIRRRVVRYYQQPDGSFYYCMKDGSYWRVLSYVFNSVNYDQAESLKILKSTGVAFGSFQADLTDFPADELYETISDFHNTEKRFADLYEAAEKDEYSRLCEVKDEFEYLKSKASCASMFREMSESGEIPLRVVHNDTKCNNVMFDDKTGDPLAVIDLDTVMPGYVAYDFGDAVRFAANTASEDEKDLSKVSLDIDKYDAFAEGFLSQTADMLTKNELRTLPDGVLAITLELAARFMTDYLNGDKYFKCKMEKHNLIRTRVQIELAKDIERKMPKLREHLLALYYAHFASSYAINYTNSKIKQ